MLLGEIHCLDVDAAPGDGLRGVSFVLEVL